MHIVHDIYPGYRFLKPITTFAGIIGVLQSLTWIGLTITGIVAHYCMIDFSKTDANVATITRLTIFELYFRGSCSVKGYPEVNFRHVENSTILTSFDVNIIVCVYLVLNFFWLISSSSIFLTISKKHLHRTVILLSIWIFITFAISSLDLALGIVFGIDFQIFYDKSYPVQLEDTGTTKSFPLLSAQLASVIMMLVAFKGFLLWITNIALTIYFFIEIFNIRTAASSKTSYDNSGFTPEHSILTRSPIHAFGLNRRFDEEEIEKPTETPIEKPFVKPYEKPTPIPVRLEPEPIKRAHAMSIKGLRERFENRQKAIDKKNKAKSNKNDDNKYAMGNENSFKPGPKLPDPDYSPAMSRVNPYVNNNNNRSSNTRY